MMKTRALRFLLVALVGLALVPATPAFAQQMPTEAELEELDARLMEAGFPPVDRDKLARIEAEGTKRAIMARRLPISKRITRYTTAIVEELDAGRNERALEIGNRLNLRRQNELERAQIYRLMGHVHYQLGDLEGAIASFRQASDQGALSITEEEDLRYSIAQLYAAQQKWEELLAALEHWFELTIEASPDAAYLSAIAHYQLGNLEESLFFAENAIRLADFQESQAKESWLQLVAALYIAREDWNAARPVLERMVTEYPKKQYWVQLSLIYGASEDYRHALPVQQIAYLQGFLDQDAELNRLARSYLFNGLPFQAAQVLENGLEAGFIKENADTYELLANSWIQARDFDRSMEPLQKAAELSENGDLYVRLGQVHMQREEWEKSAELFRQALAKGDLANKGQVQLLLGIAYYNTEAIVRAMDTFSKARTHDAKTRKQADQWLAHIQKETQSAGDSDDAGV